MNEKAELLFTQIFFRTFTRFFEVDSFRRATKQTMPYAKELAQEESHGIVRSLAYDSEYDKLFIDKEGFFRELGGVEAFSLRMAEKQIESYQTSIDASSIVLAHSIIDAAAFDYFLVIEMVAPLEDWDPFINKRQVVLENLKNRSYEDIVRQTISKYIQELERKSLLEKIDKLFQICKPPAKFYPIRNYVYNRDRIEKLDSLRHDIVHGDGLPSPLVTCDQDIKYMQKTSNFLMALVNHKYDIKMNTTLYKEYLKSKPQK